MTVWQWKVIISLCRLAAKLWIARGFDRNDPDYRLVMEAVAREE